MTERDNELARHSAENGSFDPAKARKTTTDAVSRFNARLKWTARLTWIYILAGVGVMLFSCNSLLAASTTKAIVGFGILLLVAYETTILMKLWYWNANTKFTLLRELKQWQLQTALSSTDAPSSVEVESPLRRLGLSRRERIAWFAALVAVCIGVSSIGPITKRRPSQRLVNASP